MIPTNPRFEAFEMEAPPEACPDRNCYASFLDRDSIRFFDSLNLNTFENLPNAMEEFLERLQLMGGPATLADAAMALDAAACAFSEIDVEHDFVMTRKELHDYLSDSSHERKKRSLGWLIDNFSAFERMSFFGTGISRNEIEAARDVVHGLSYIDGKLDAIMRAAPDHSCSAGAIAEHLHKQHENMEEHEVRGIVALIKHWQAFGHRFGDV